MAWAKHLGEWEWKWKIAKQNMVVKIERPDEKHNFCGKMQKCNDTRCLIKLHTETKHTRILHLQRDADSAMISVPKVIFFRLDSWALPMAHTCMHALTKHHVLHGANRRKRSTHKYTLSRTLIERESELRKTLEHLQLFQKICCKAILKRFRHLS